MRRKTSNIAAKSKGKAKTFWEREKRKGDPVKGNVFFIGVGKLKISM